MAKHESEVKQLSQIEGERMASVKQLDTLIGERRAECARVEDALGVQRRALETLNQEMGERRTELQLLQELAEKHKLEHAKRLRELEHRESEREAQIQVRVNACSAGGVLVSYIQSIVNYKIK